MAEFFTAVNGFLAAAKAWVTFEAVWKGRRGQARVLIDELKQNSLLCSLVVDDGVSVQEVISSLSTVQYDSLNAEGFNFKVLKRQPIPTSFGLEGTDLARLQGKSTEWLVVNIYDKIKKLQTKHRFLPDDPTLRRLVINIHKRLDLLARHIRD